MINAEICLEQNMGLAKYHPYKLAFPSIILYKAISKIKRYYITFETWSQRYIVNLWSGRDIFDDKKHRKNSYAANQWCSNNRTLQKKEIATNQWSSAKQCIISFKYHTIEGMRGPIFIIFYDLLDLLVLRRVHLRRISTV